MSTLVGISLKDPSEFHFNSKITFWKMLNLTIVIILILIFSFLMMHQRHLLKRCSSRESHGRLVIRKNDSNRWEITTTTPCIASTAPTDTPTKRSNENEIFSKENTCLNFTYSNSKLLNNFVYFKWIGDKYLIRTLLWYKVYVPTTTTNTKKYK